MFIRELKSVTGKVYVQVVDKSSGRYKVLKSFGGAVNDEQLVTLRRNAQHWIAKQSGSGELDFSKSDILVEQLFESITSVKRIGYDLLLGRIFDVIGFDKVKNEFFKNSFWPA